MNSKAELAALKRRIVELEKLIAPEPEQPARAARYLDLAGNELTLDRRFPPKKVTRASDGAFVVHDEFYNSDPVVESDEVRGQRWRRRNAIERAREDAFNQAMGGSVWRPDANVAEAEAAANAAAAALAERFEAEDAAKVAAKAARDRKYDDDALALAAAEAAAKS